MMTPFGSDFAKELVTEELCLYKGQTVLSYLYDVYFDLVAGERDEKTNKEIEEVLKQQPDLTDEDIEDIINDRSVDYELAYSCWAAACLLDAALCGTDYSGDCIGYADKYEEAVKHIKSDASKKKLFSHKPVHDIPKIAGRASDSLDYVMGIPAQSDLADEMRENGKYDEFCSSVKDLQQRLNSLAY